MHYTNLFANLPADQRVRTTIELPTKIKSVINSYDSKMGVLQTTFSLLFTKLTDELAKSNIPAGEHDKYRHAVAECTISLPVVYYTNSIPPDSNRTDSVQRVAAAKPATRPKRNRTAQAAG